MPIQKKQLSAPYYNIGQLRVVEVSRYLHILVSLKKRLYEIIQRTKPLSV
jgi:hypothetical protein